MSSSLGDQLRNLARRRLRQSRGIMSIEPQGPLTTGKLPFIADGLINPSNGMVELVLGLLPQDMSGSNAAIILDLSAPSEFDAKPFDPRIKQHARNKSPLLQLGVPPIVSAIRHFGPEVCRYDGDGQIQVILGSMGEFGGEFRDLGKFDEAAIRAFELGEFSHGDETRILPSIQYALDVLTDQPHVRFAWIGVLTTGDFDDHVELTAWAEEHIEAMHRGHAPETKVVMMAQRGANMRKLRALDNLRVPGISLDLFDCQVTGDIAETAQLLFAEPLRTKSMVVADRGIIYANGQMIREYDSSDGPGVPQVITFQVAPHTRELQMSIDNGDFFTVKLY